jgi:RHH-type rel operon transcriptional repressor/antitoxin RelB
MLRATYLYDKEASMLSLRLPEELEDRLEKLAKSTGRTKTYYAREAIETYIQDLEDLYLAEKVYGEYLAGKVKSRPISELASEYGL